MFNLQSHKYAQACDTLTYSDVLIWFYTKLIPLKGWITNRYCIIEISQSNVRWSWSLMITDMLSWAIIHNHPSHNAYNNVVKTIINHPSGNGFIPFYTTYWRWNWGWSIIVFPCLTHIIYIWLITHNYYVYHYEPESSSIKFPDILLMLSFPGSPSHATMLFVSCAGRLSSTGKPTETASCLINMIN